METQTWLFELEGEHRDLETIVELFGDCNQLLPAEGKWLLLTTLPSSMGAPDVRVVAGERLARFNASAQVTYGNHENVRLGAMSCVDPSGGPATQFISATGIAGQSRVGGGKLIADRLLAAADKDEYFDRALYLFGVVPHDWRGLSVVLDVGKEGNGKERGLIAKGWVPGSSIVDFRETANSFRAVGHQARHGGVKTGVPHASQSLEEARAMIRTILEKWARDLA